MAHGSGMVTVVYILLATKFSMILEPYSLALLPFASLTNRIAPFDRYCRGDCVLEEPYRAVVNDGVLAYQLHVYLGLVRQHFGMKIKRLVHKYQLGMLADVAGTGREIADLLELIKVALGTAAITIHSCSSETEVPLEMNIAVLLLMDAPQSPDFVAAPAQRAEQIGRIGMDVDWCFAECLARGRAEILDACVPLFEGANLARHS